MEFKEFKELINKIDVPDDGKVEIVGEAGGTYENTYFEEDVEKLVMVNGKFQLMSKYHFETEVTSYFWSKITDLNPGGMRR